MKPSDNPLTKIGILNETLFRISGTEVTAVTLITVVLIVVVTYLISRLLQRAIVRAFQFRGVTDVGTTGIAKRVVHYVVMVIGLGVGLQTLGLNLNTLFAAGALFAVAIGFAMQNIAQNFVSGMILLVERTIKPGDVLDVEGRVVRVERMGLRSTIARSRDEEDLIVPNATLVQSTVTNYTLRDSQYRVRANVGVAYESDMRLVRTTLEKAARSVASRNAVKDPRVLLTEFGNSTVNFDISIWIDDPWNAPGAQSALNEAVWFGLQDAGITIAFPQMDVHFDRPVSRSFAALGPGVAGRLPPGSGEEPTPAGG